jgi:hypothetical protein
MAPDVKERVGELRVSEAHGTHDDQSSIHHLSDLPAAAAAFFGSRPPT